MSNFKTRVLCVDMEQDIIDFLKSESLEVYNGSLGPIIDARNYKYSWDVLPLELDLNIPDNLHEYSVIIEDLSAHRETITYDYTKNDVKGKFYDAEDNFRCLCLKWPQNIFDPVPFGTAIIDNNLKYKEDFLIKILFQAKRYEVGYYQMNNNYYREEVFGRFSNYQYVNNFTLNAKCGDCVVVANNKLAKTLFADLIGQISYVQTYFHSYHYDTDGITRIKNKNFLPLLTNVQGEIISYAYYEENKSFTIMFPILQNKRLLLERLFKEFLYQTFSELFPMQKENSWLTNREYELPEIIKLNRDKEEALRIYEETIVQKDKEIKVIREKYDFLFDMLIETGDSLVNNVKHYLEWLGFDNVQSMDEEVKEGEDFQEDLQIHLANNELLIIEVKGLYGTSKDNECSQISKIELRRIHERKYSNVHSLYIVNNERGKEPLKRQMPPFTETQIKDAEFAHRAMAYTYQLFNLYFEIEAGIITKEEARNALFQNGFVDFRSNFKSLGKPYGYFKNNKVVCIELHDTILSVGDKVYFEDDRQRLNVVEIVNIQVDRQNRQTVKDGKVGIEFNMKIPKGAVLLNKVPIASGGLIPHNLARPLMVRQP